MKKLLFALANVLLVNISVYSQEAIKAGPVGFDVRRDSIAHGEIDTITSNMNCGMAKVRPQKS